MEQRLAELEEKDHALQEEQERLREEMEDIKRTIVEERLKTLVGKEDYYAKKMKRIKAFVEAFVAETAYESRGARIEPRNSNLVYGFRKRELPYTDDFHEAMADPLDWAVAEYDLLGMQECLEIQFDYHSEVIKDFVTQWMQENLPHVDYREDLFALRR